jgi:3-methyl-2-oxobutanoate hydroxymethyltransferase
MGGFKTQGRVKEEWAAIEKDAKDLDKAGVFAMVVEGVAEPLAAKLTKLVKAPTIGIGASKECDGQILVLEDMLGLSPWVPKFVKEFGQIGAAIEGAVELYAEEVRDRSFPSEAETYQMLKKSSLNKSSKTKTTKAKKRPASS